MSTSLNVNKTEYIQKVMQTYVSVFSFFSIAIFNQNA